MSYGFEDFITNEGDTVVVDFYRSYAPIGDTITTRRQALVGWAGLSAWVKTHGYKRAAIMYVWTKQPTDSLGADTIVAHWIMPFAMDGDGCWHIVGDSTPISTCVARDDPDGPGAEASRQRP